MKGGGIYEVVENLSVAQASNCMAEVDILCLENYSNKKNDNRIFRCCMPNKFISIAKIIETLRFCKNVCANYDIIHIHGAWSIQFILFLPLLYWFRTKIFYQPHGLLDPVRCKKSWLKKKIAWHIYQKFFMMYSCQVIACSLKEKLELELFYSFGKKISIVPNGIDNIFFKTAPNFINRQKNRLLFLSQIIPIKNIEAIIKAISILKHANQFNLYLDIYGYGSQQYINELTCLSTDLNVSDYIKFKGSVDRDSRVDLYDKYSYFILPSLSENFGIVVLEALSRGCVVITSDMTPWRDYAHENLLITSVDVTSLMNTLTSEFSTQLNHQRTINYNNNTLEISSYNWYSIAQVFDKLYKYQYISG